MVAVRGRSSIPFAGSIFYRRCEAATDGELCESCDNLRKSAVNGKISLNIAAHETNNMAVMKRPAVINVLKYWEEEGARL